MLKLYSFLFVLLSIAFFSCKENHESKYEITLEEESNSVFNYFPTSTSNAVYHRSGFSFSYVEKHEQSEWVAYELTANDLKSINYERPYFNQDPMVVSASADWRNFKNSGYDKGHLCPAGDRKSSLESYEETFFTSNISPQIPEFNNGVWNRLEQKTRYWATKYDGLYVVTGGVLESNLKTIGREKVSVPAYFYKILMTKDKSKMIGFLVPHKPSNEPLYSFVVSVDEIEKLTGIDFFPVLEDALESNLEKETSYKKWSF